MFFSRNLERDLGTFPFINLLMDLKASAVLLNLWKSSRVSLKSIKKVQFLEALDVVEVLLEVLYFFEFLWLVASEKSESGSCLEKDQHLSVSFYYYN